jgi:S-formylglutathione hydrolase
MRQTMRQVASNRCYTGVQYVYEHRAQQLGCDMRVAVYVPDSASSEAQAPGLLWLSGLTCTEDNFTAKAGAQRLAAELGLILIVPDTSPRGEGVPDDPDGAYDFGLGAGFYVDATQSPWATHYRMRSYIETELLDAVAAVAPLALERIGISGHSMGGHGALTMALRAPQRYTSVSAFAPICSPINCPWGQKALGNYLGKDRSNWRQYDACALIEDGARVQEIFVDQGLADDFIDAQLRPDLLEAACGAAGIELSLRRQPGFDHNYYFIASFIEDHLRWHAERL